MPQETEAKLRVESHEPIRERLRALRAAPLGRVLETNRILDRGDGSLSRKGRGLRLRSTVDDETGECRATLTLKGPVAPGPFKSREELEVQISDVDTAARMLEGLGFVPILTYQKRRESWLLGECRIELDEPPHIGLFVEIEGPSEQAIRAVQTALELGEAEHVRASYVRMLAEYCDQHGLADRVVGLSGKALPSEGDRATR